MSDTARVPFIFLVTVPLIFLPIASNAWADQRGHDDGRSHHGHDYHAHANPDLTLVSGMDYIDSRVLVDPAPAPDPQEVDQPVAEVAAPTPAQIIRSDAETDFIVNVPNKAGGYTPIRIQKSGNGYIGPQGELYYPFPQISQLKAMYGL